MRPKSRLRKQLVIIVVLTVALIALAGTASVTANLRSEETKGMELRIVQAAVAVMMAKNNITTLPNPVTVPTTDMALFPDVATSPEAKGLRPGDGSGYVLRGHDMTPDGWPGPSVNYFVTLSTRWAYTVTPDGKVLQSTKRPG